MKAIETAYKGHRFRSRLEARWAVFLDSLGFEYRYEEEGFDLGGVRYLPDFFVPSWECWVEVKSGALIEELDAGNRSGWDSAHEKALRLHEQSGNPVMLLIGNPWPREHTVILFASWADGAQARLSEFCLCASCGALALADDPGVSRDPHRFWYVLSKPAPHTNCDHRAGPWWLLDHGAEEPSDHLGRAFLAARRARFEFGEHGR